MTFSLFQSSYLFVFCFLLFKLCMILQKRLLFINHSNDTFENIDTAALKQHIHMSFNRHSLSSLISYYRFLKNKDY
jgi:hypothetical protein